MHWSWENDYWHTVCRGELVAFSLLSPLSINLQFIFNTGDMETRDMLLLCPSENRYALICLLQLPSGNDTDVIF